MMLVEAKTDSHDQRLRQIRSRKNLSTILTGAAVLLGAVVLPLVYYFGFFSGRVGEVSALEIWRHIGLNAAANLFVTITAARAAGRVDRQIGAVFNSAIMAHGAVAFISLALRIYYSNQLMLVSAALSIILALFLLWARRQFHVQRAALVGPWHPVASRLKIAHDHLEESPRDLRGYDLILTTSVALPAGWSEYLTHAMMAGKPIRHVAEYIEEELGAVSVEHFHLDHLPDGGLTSYQARKRLMDIGLVVVALPVAFVLIAVGAAAIWLTMKGPVFFVQPRVGLGGRVFRMYKLRTMKLANGREKQATSRGDARVTPVGMWLRRFRIDELPQLWNVLKGDMSIIGPRPEQPELTDEYCKHLPAFAYRSLVRPGITGWAQVRAGYASDLSETKAKLSFDLFYIKNFSFSLDMQIIMRTAGTLLTGGGVR